MTDLERHLLVLEMLDILAQLTKIVKQSTTYPTELMKEVELRIAKAIETSHIRVEPTDAGPDHYAGIFTG